MRWAMYLISMRSMHYARSGRNTCTHWHPLPEGNPGAIRGRPGGWNSIRIQRSTAIRDLRLGCTAARGRRSRYCELRSSLRHRTTATQDDAISRTTQYPARRNIQHDSRRLSPPPGLAYVLIQVGGLVHAHSSSGAPAFCGTMDGIVVPRECATSDAFVSHIGKCLNHSACACSHSALSVFTGVFTGTERAP